MSALPDTKVKTVYLLSQLAAKNAHPQDVVDVVRLMKEMQEEATIGPDVDEFVGGLTGKIYHTDTRSSQLTAKTILPEMDLVDVAERDWRISLKDTVKAKAVLLHTIQDPRDIVSVGDVIKFMDEDEAPKPKKKKAKKRTWADKEKSKYAEKDSKKEGDEKVGDPNEEFLDEPAHTVSAVFPTGIQLDTPLIKRHAAGATFTLMTWKRKVVHQKMAAQNIRATAGFIRMNTLDGSVCILTRGNLLLLAGHLELDDQGAEALKSAMQAAAGEGKRAFGLRLRWSGRKRTDQPCLEDLAVFGRKSVAFPLRTKRRRRGSRGSRCGCLVSFLLKWSLLLYILYLALHSPAGSKLAREVRISHTGRWVESRYLVVKRLLLPFHTAMMEACTSVWATISGSPAYHAICKQAGDAVAWAKGLRWQAVVKSVRESECVQLATSRAGVVAAGFHEAAGPVLRPMGEAMQSGWRSLFGDELKFTELVYGILNFVWNMLNLAVTVVEIQWHATNKWLGSGGWHGLAQSSFNQVLALAIIVSEQLWASGTDLARTSIASLHEALL